MTDRERFDVILEYLGALLSRVGWLCDVVMMTMMMTGSGSRAAREVMR